MGQGTHTFSVETLESRRLLSATVSQMAETMPLDFPLDSQFSGISAATDAAGNFVVVGTSGGGSYQVQRYTAEGEKLGEPGELTQRAGIVSSPVVARAANGHTVVAWSGNVRSGSTFVGYIRARVFDAQGQAVGGEIDVVSAKQKNFHFARVATDASGSFVVAWEGPTTRWNIGVFAQRFDASGRAVGKAITVSGSDRASYPAVAMDSDGDFLVTWGSGGTRGQRYDSGGRKVGEEFLIRPVGDDAHVDLADDGRFVVAWDVPRTVTYEGWQHTTYDGYARAYDASGAPVTDGDLVDDDGDARAEIRLYEATPEDVAAGALFQLESFDVAPGGNFVATYSARRLAEVFTTTTHPCTGADLGRETRFSPERHELQLFTPSGGRAADPVLIGSSCESPVASLARMQGDDRVLVLTTRSADVSPRVFFTRYQITFEPVAAAAPDDAVFGSLDAEQQDSEQLVLL